jgi:hypothetical protein
MLKEFNKFYTPEYKKFIDEELTMEKQWVKDGLNKVSRMSWADKEKIEFKPTKEWIQIYNPLWNITGLIYKESPDDDVRSYKLTKKWDKEYDKKYIFKTKTADLWEAIKVWVLINTTIEYSDWKADEDEKDNRFEIWRNWALQFYPSNDAHNYSWQTADVITDDLEDYSDWFPWFYEDDTQKYIFLPFLNGLVKDWVIAKWKKG